MSTPLTTNIFVSIDVDNNFKKIASYKGYIAPLSKDDDITIDGILHEILSIRVQKNLFESAPTDAIGVNILYKLRKVK